MTWRLAKYDCTLSHWLGSRPFGVKILKLSLRLRLLANCPKFCAVSRATGLWSDRHKFDLLFLGDSKFQCFSESLYCFIAISEAFFYSKKIIFRSETFLSKKLWDIIYNLEFHSILNTFFPKYSFFPTYFRAFWPINFYLPQNSRFPQKCNFSNFLKV